MSTRVKVTRIGNLAGIVLPDDVLAALRAGIGDTVYVTEVPDGIRITATAPDSSAKFDLAEQIMHEDRDILRHLSK